MFNLQPFCDKEVIISAEEYESPPNDHVTITNVKIEGDCLILKYVASGCDESAWVVKLMDAGIVAESYPVQRTLRLSLENKEMCSAYIGKETSFDRSKLQVQGKDKVSLPIADQNILYEYLNIKIVNKKKIC